MDVKINNLSPEEVKEIQKGFEISNKALRAKKGYEVLLVEVEKLSLLKKNARFMKKETFQQLVKNIKNDGRLEGTVLTVPDEEKKGNYLVISGNHRVQGAQEAGEKYIIVINIVQNLSKEQKIAKQLSHNAIVGEDDPVCLKELFAEIQNVDLKEYSGLDDEVLKNIPSVDFSAITEPNLKVKTIVFNFFEPEAKNIEQIIDELKESSNKKTYTASQKTFYEFIELVKAKKQELNIVNTETLFLELLKLKDNAG